MVIYNHKQQLIGAKWLLQRPSFTVMEKWQYYNNKNQKIYMIDILLFVVGLTIDYRFFLS